MTNIPQNTSSPILLVKSWGVEGELHTWRWSLLESPIENIYWVREMYLWGKWLLRDVHRYITKTFNVQLKGMWTKELIKSDPKYIVGAIAVFSNKIYCRKVKQFTIFEIMKEMIVRCFRHHMECTKCQQYSLGMLLFLDLSMNVNSLAQIWNQKWTFSINDIGRGIFGFGDFNNIGNSPDITCWFNNLESFISRENGWKNYPI